MAAVEDRSRRFIAAKARNADPEEMFGICGRVDPNAQCKTKVGRPKDSESLACDSLCCLGGYKVGNCGSDYGVELDFAKIVTNLVVGGATGGPVGAIVGGLTPSLAANCYCSDDPIDVKCGRDGSFLNIRCPDNSACWRKCCRQGKSGGKCSGFAKLKCKCN